MSSYLPKYYRKAHEVYRDRLLVDSANDRAKAFGRAFDLRQHRSRVRTQIYDVRACQVTGAPFDLETPRGPFSPSLDRIDNSKGYTADNCRVVVLCLNLGVSNFPILDFYRMLENKYNPGAFTRPADPPHEITDITYPAPVAWKIRNFGRATVRSIRSRKPGLLDEKDYPALMEHVQDKVDAGRCELTGARFTTLPGPRNINTPSVDRIDPKGKYAVGNVRVVCSGLNLAMSDWGFPPVLHMFNCWRGLVGLAGFSSPNLLSIRG